MSCHVMLCERIRIITNQVIIAKKGIRVPHLNKYETTKAFKQERKEMPKQGNYTMLFSRPSNTGYSLFKGKIMAFVEMRW